MSERIKTLYGRRVLILRDKEAQGAILVPDASLRDLNTGTVVYAGIPVRATVGAPDEQPGYIDYHLDLLALAGSGYICGQRVMFSPVEGLQIDVPNAGIVPGTPDRPAPERTTLWLVADEGIVAVLEPVPPPVRTTEEVSPPSSGG